MMVMWDLQWKKEQSTKDKVHINTVMHKLLLNGYNQSEI